MGTPDDSLVTIATFHDDVFAHLVQARLEAEGVESYLAGESLFSMQAMVGCRGLELQVRQSEAEQAVEILNSIKLLYNKSYGKRADVADNSCTHCPRCYSKNIYFGSVPLYMMILNVLLLGVLLPFVSRRWHCRDCGYKWLRSYSD